MGGHRRGGAAPGLRRPPVMREQLEHLLEVNALPNVDVQVRRCAAGPRRRRRAVLDPALRRAGPARHRLPRAAHQRALPRQARRRRALHPGHGPALRPGRDPRRVTGAAAQPAARHRIARSGEQLGRLPPHPAHHLTRRFLGGQRRALPGPVVHPVQKKKPPRDRRPHPSDQPALVRERSRTGRPGRSRPARSGWAPPAPAAHSRPGWRRCPPAPAPPAGGPACRFRSRARSSAVPTCTALAPNVSAAASPRPSAIPPAATTGTSRRSANRGEQGEKPTSVRSAAAGSKLPRCPPASIPCATTASAPASCAASASSTVVAQANQAMPSRGKRPDVVGPEHPHDRRDRRRPSAQHGRALLVGNGGRGAQRLPRRPEAPRGTPRRPPPAPAPPPASPGSRCSAARAPEGAGAERPSIPRCAPARPAPPRPPPIPPASATAIASSGGQAPAIGAGRTGTAGRTERRTARPLARAPGNRHGRTVCRPLWPVASTAGRIGDMSFVEYLRAHARRRFRPG